MNRSIHATQQGFESSCSKTPQYLAWHRLFKREFTKFLTEIGATVIQIGKPNHFDMSGFFTMDQQAWWFRVEDLRWSKDTMLVRTARDYKDYTGGRNNSVTLCNAERFQEQFTNLVRANARLQQATSSSA